MTLLHIFILHSKVVGNEKTKKLQGMLSKSNSILNRLFPRNICISISQQPSAEQLPCEYCGQLYSLKNFDSHQVVIKNSNFHI